ncbi:MULTISPECIES: PH domain-containing protein [Pseudoalteromonas]|uniref:PH domain-containing protein n=1 Tax=Pseudoalteromonas TaxID=53246 RepID=UPI0002C95E45|nr:MULTISPECIES: PH domain-containing protein [Pseudoalteromonas]MCP4059879.1 PH domain-containing protein [Pseudoalteromonas sp.]ENO00541.1 stress protein [Pseudoalteromonas agarivorans S816]MDC9565225.1 PH domain-containing protein [Pseudoalteromonas sp. GAB2316C]MDC9569554.1 PH domain-containing protein [Pseudoalteromonas sp. GABNB9D]MDC9573777.1 PH domain-containing protein [Pseudoalteromonas sp. GABNS16A]|tara:strand:- start:1801 stop:3345 length:1545 start_codon:yes stop_codon:yes gene_type:complete
MSNTISEEQSSSLHWQKVSPWAVLYFVVYFSVRFVKDGLLNLLPMLVVFVTQVENKLFWAQVVGAIAIVTLLIYSILYYINFKFCISDDHEILLNKGVFKKERLTLKFSRVQNVNIAEPFYFTPVNLVNCIFDAAGSVTQEAVLPGVTKAYAQQMRKQIFAFKAQQQPDEKTPSSEHFEAENSLRISNKEIAKFGLMSNMAILAMAAIAPFINVLVDFLEQQIIAKVEGFYQQELGLLASAATFAMITLIALLVLTAVMLSVGMSLIRFYNFELYFKGQKFKRIAGLLERHQLSMSMDKVQSIVIKQNLMGRLLKRFTVECLQASSGGIAAGVAAKKNKQTLVLPVLNSEQVDSVCQWIYPWFNSKKLQFNGAERALLYKNLSFYALIPSAIVLLGCYLGDFNAWLSLGVLLILAGLVTLAYQRYGYYLHEDNGRFYMVVRKGMIGVHYRVFELYKAQSARSISTYFMRRAGLKSLYIQLASGFAFMPYIKQQDADYIIDFTLYQAESTQRNWM